MKLAAKPAILMGWLGIIIGIGSILGGLIALESHQDWKLFGVAWGIIGLAAGGLIALLSGLVALWAGKRWHGASISLAGVGLLSFAAFAGYFLAAGLSAVGGAIPS